MAKRYEEDNGDWFLLGKGFRWACCSCHLVHDVEVRFRNGMPEMRIIRHERATAALRRKLKRRVVIVDE